MFNTETKKIKLKICRKSKCTHLITIIIVLSIKIINVIFLLLNHSILLFRIQGGSNTKHSGDGVPLGVLFISNLFLLAKGYLHDLGANTSLKKLHKEMKGCYYNILEKLENAVFRRHLIMLLQGLGTFYRFLEKPMDASLVMKGC